MSNFRVFRTSFNEKKGIELSADEAHHAFTVLRLKVTDNFEVKTAHQSITLDIVDIQNNHLSVRVNTCIEVTTTGPHIELIQCLPKQDKMSDVIRMCTEIGVDTISPIISERVIRKLDPKSLNHSQMRWGKVMDSANKQCQRQQPAKMESVCQLNDYLKGLETDAPDTRRLVAWENADLTKSIKQLDHSLLKKATHISILIGPEGGLSYTEIETLIDKKFTPISLGNTILRTEHAAFAAIIQLKYALS